ncbi:MAG TPA: SusC/RagA family TonB-linked outer membrane protein, partial [Flavisolibacter sp.]|nr:SusC/RagA family TonB-linked outer membrane protein [Flavisolibacter sp.]
VERADSLPPPIEVRGRIISETNEPVLATVSVKGTTNRTATDVNGFFVLKNVDENATLVITSVSTQTFEVSVARRSFLGELTAKTRNVAMDPFTVTVSTGYQTLTRERATGSFSKPDMEVFANRVASLDVINRLDGQVAGLAVTQGGLNQSVNGNGNGLGQQRSVVRGLTSSRLNSDPLYVLNGVIVTDYNAINVNDILDITVLKDAAAAAIWGSRAANGVVIVTTKSGASNNKIRVSYSGSTSFQGKPDLGYTQVLNSREYIQAAKEIFNPVVNPYASVSGSPSGYLAPHEAILYNRHRGVISEAQANAQLDSLANLNNLGQIEDIWFRNAVTSNHTVSVSGGGSVYSFYTSLSYSNVKSNVVAEKNESFNLNLGQEIRGGKRLKIGLNTSLRNVVSSRKRPISIGSNWVPYQLFRDEAGNSIDLPWAQGWSDSLRRDYQTRSRIPLNYSPINEINSGSTENNILLINLTANVSLNLWKGLSFLGTYNYSKTPGTTISYDDVSQFALRKQLVNLTVAPTPASTPVYYLPTTGGTYSVSRNDDRVWTVRNQLSYAGHVRQGKDHLSVQVGQEANERFSFRESNTLYGYNQALQTSVQLDNVALNAGIPNTVTSGPFGRGFFFSSPYFTSQDKSRFISYFALGSYTFNNKYSLDGSWRVDQSNQFGSDRSVQNRPVWSIGGKWHISRERFLAKTKWVNDLALRGTYGRTGNSPNSVATSLDILSAQSPTFFGSSIVAGPALVISSPANRSLAWEITQTFNFGIDFSLFNRRATGSIDIYRKKTTDLIASPPPNPFSGVTFYNSNAGELRNQGIEFSIRVANIDKGNFKWSTNYVFSYNHNKLIDYGPIPSFLTSASSKTTTSYFPGYSLQPVFAYQYAGLDSLGDPLILLANKTTTKANIATGDDVVYMGTARPPYNGGITNTFSYKGLSLAVNLIYNLGHVLRADVNTFYSGRFWTNPGSFSAGNVHAEFANRWKKRGDEAFTNIPSYVADFTSFTRRVTDYYVRGDLNVVSGSYAKIRDITLSYSIPSAAAKLLRLDAATVSVQATNFLLWTANDRGIDPEFFSSSFGFGGRINPPFRHAYSMSVNLNF